MFTNLQLVDFVLWVLSIGAKYWYGTFGKLATTSLYTSKKAQYPSHYGSDRTSTYKAHIAALLRVCDCVGLIKWFFWALGSHAESDIKYASNGVKDLNANDMFKLCAESGPIKTLPEIPGLVLWCSGHIGVYVGGGYAVEARAFAYGVVKTKVSERTWTHWGKLPMLEYVDDDGIATALPELSKGDKGPYVTRMQTLLVAEDAHCLPTCGADGDFGMETEMALMKYQIKYELTERGICGGETWAALLGETELHQPEDDADYSEPSAEDEPVNPYKEPTSNLARGSKGEGVRWVQWSLINAGYSCGVAGIDGDFGGKTHAAVLDYQADKGLKVDGVVGKNTRCALREESASPEMVETAKPGVTDRLPVIADLSQFNSLTSTKNDWEKITANADLLILRCGVTRTETSPKGIGIDDHFAYAAKTCAERGIPFGVYYYGKVSSADEARKEARKAYETASPFNPLFYVYDVEEDRLTDACIAAFVGELRALGAKKVGLYIGHNYYTKHQATVSLFDFVWIPRYGKNTGDYDPQYNPAYPCDLHQYTSVGRVPGINDNTVDLNRLTGTKPLGWFLERT